MLSAENLNNLIVWAPTLLFVVILFIGFIVGVIRGFRKSLILFFHMLLLGTFCIVGYAWFCSMPEFDTKIVELANEGLGLFNNSLQGLLNVDSSLVSLKDILMEVILSNMSQEDIIYHIVNDNAAYIMTMVEVAYRLVLFVLSLVIYLILTFIFYLIYLIFYPTRRVVKKHNKKFRSGKVDRPYNKKRLLGGLVGTFRGVINGVITLSFLGALLFIATGGTTLASREELNENEIIDFGDENFNNIYDYYSLICDMGDTGIYKVLNNIKDQDNVPYYFYFCDLVLQGSINDPNVGIDETFYLRDEVGYYVGFTKDVMALLIKYAGEDLPILISGNGSTNISNPSQTDDSKLLNTVLRIMSKPGFSEEFNLLIDGFEAKTYFVNLGLSALTSVVNHIDLIDASDEVKGLIKCMFVDGEYSIKVTDLATEDDVRHLFKVVINLLSSADISSEYNESETIIKLVQQVLPHIKELSCFKDEERKAVANNFLGSVYEYCAETFIGEIELDIPETINWINEFEILLDFVDPMLDIYLNLSLDSEEEPMDVLMYMFAEDNPHAEANEAAYDKMVEKLSSSVLLDAIFKLDMVNEMMNETLASITGNPESSIPMKSLKYSNTIDENGNIVYGEAYKFLNVFKKAIKSDCLSLLSGSSNQGMRDVFTMLNSTDESGKTMLESFLDSQLFHYFLSAIITDITVTDSPIIIPDVVITKLVEEEIEYNIIRKEEIIGFVTSMERNLDIILPSDGSYMPLLAILKDEAFAAAIDDSIIFEYTFTNMLIDRLTYVNDIVIPEGKDNIEYWVSSRNEDLSVLEHKETYNFINGVLSLVVSDDVETTDFDNLVNLVEINEVNKNNIVESFVLTATVSKHVIASELYIPASVCNEDIIIEEELLKFLDGCIRLYGHENANGDNYIKVSELNADNVSNIEYTEQDVLEVIKSEILALNFKTSIIEKNNIITPIAVTLSISIVGGEDLVVFNDTEFNNLVKAFFAINPTINLSNIDTFELTLYQSKLDVYLASEVFKATLSNELSKLDEVVIPPTVIELIDVYGYTEKKEIITDEELRNLLEGLFVMFGVAEGEDVKLELEKDLPINISSVTPEMVETITRSQILMLSIYGA